MQEHISTLMVEYGLANRASDGSMVLLLDRPKDIALAMNVSDSQINQCSTEILEQYMNALSSYLMYIQAQHNLRCIEYIEARGYYEREMARERCKIVGSTNKDREARALDGSAKLQELALVLQRAESGKQLTEKIPDAIKEKLNVYKKIFGARHDERSID